jgi:hypothetical protein
MMRKFHQVIALISLLLIAGCSHIGPQTIPRDRFDYNNAISHSWKEQTLLNIVKVRYADMPLFVEVSSIVSGYTLEHSGVLGATASLGPGSSGDSLALGGASKFTDRPTITYVPITGTHFNQTFMHPIPPDAILFLMQSGWPVDLIFPLTVDGINGYRSQVVAGTSTRSGDVGYYRIIELLREVQKSGATGMRIDQQGDGQESTVLLFYKKVLSPELQATLSEVNSLLGLKDGLHEAKVNYGLIAKDNTEIAMLTRSMLHIMITLATLIDVPPEHVADGRTPPSTPLMTSSDGQPKRLFKVSYSVEKPENAFVSVKYKNYWYWIDDRDFSSKRTFTFLMILFSMAEKGGNQKLPLVTIPSG